MADEVKTGQAAQRILDDPVFQRAVEAADASYVERWRGGVDLEEREEAHALQRALRDVVNELEIFVANADISRSRFG